MIQPEFHEPWAGTERMALREDESCRLSSGLGHSLSFCKHLKAALYFVHTSQLYCHNNDEAISRKEH
ncbi:hypothetical protein [Bacillus xiapuensis]|uniref:hypothetical protein n=1 Tax=Bacillus xiapuensis TaxID=2014075 RepID=UPI001E2ABAC0|nr:hypothetical protein [Bacillus xiapuensis]